MKIDKNQINELNRLKNEYLKIHDKVKLLDEKIHFINIEKDIVVKELNDLRESEISLINKIEQDTGIKLTPDLLIKLLNDEEI